MAKQSYERKVLKGFTDKERVNELVKKGNISGDKVKTTKEAQDEVVNDNLEATSFEELKSLADKKGLHVEGTGKNGAIKKEDYIKALKG